MCINIEIVELQVFFVVVCQLSFWVVVEGLFIMVLVLSCCIENLEQVLQERLFDCIIWWVLFMFVGELFLVYVQVVMDELELVVRSVEQGMVYWCEQVMVVCVFLVVNNLLLLVLKLYVCMYFNVWVCIIDENVVEVLESVCKGEVDFGVNFIGVQEVEIDFQVLMCECYLVVMLVYYLLVVQSSLYWKFLVGEKLVLVFFSSGNCSLIDNVFLWVLQWLVIQYEINYVVGVISFVVVGFGVVLLLELVICNVFYKGIVVWLVISFVLSWVMGLIILKGWVFKLVVVMLV